jgi:hypothetical protein
MVNHIAKDEYQYRVFISYCHENAQLVEQISSNAATRRGYLQTIFTRYAPVIQTKLDLFDREFIELLNAQPGGPANSRQYAIDEISKVIKSI